MSRGAVLSHEVQGWRERERERKKRNRKIREDRGVTGTNCVERERERVCVDRQLDKID